MPHELTLGLQQHERLAGLGIVQHLLDEAERIAAPALQARCRRAQRRSWRDRLHHVRAGQFASDGCASCCDESQTQLDSRRVIRSAVRLDRSTSSGLILSPRSMRARRSSLSAMVSAARRIDALTTGSSASGPMRAANSLSSSRPFAQAGSGDQPGSAHAVVRLRLSPDRGRCFQLLSAGVSVLVVRGLGHRFPSALKWPGTRARGFPVASPPRYARDNLLTTTRFLDAYPLWT